MASDSIETFEGIIFNSDKNLKFSLLSSIESQKISLNSIAQEIKTIKGSRKLFGFETLYNFHNSFISKMNFEYSTPSKKYFLFTPIGQ